ncbi:MAG: tyrosine-type recombinase/integrase [Terriglobia bacterium]
MTPRFADYARTFLVWSEAHHRPATLRLHAHNLATLMPYLGHLRLDKITPGQVEEFKLARLAERRSGHKWRTPIDERPFVSRASVNRAITTLRRLFSRAALEYPELANSLVGVSRFHERGQMRVISRREESNYLEATRSRNLADVARLMLETGMRPSEITGLRASDVDLNRLVVYVAHAERGLAPAVPGKTENAMRAIPLTRIAAGILWQRLAQCSGRDSFLFPSKSVSGHVENLVKSHARCVTRASIRPHFRLYDLRHTFATRLAEAGVPLPVISALLGHSSIAMTMRYIHPQEEAMRAAIAKLDSGAA